MTVSLTISKTLGGSAVDDVLSGDAGNEGVDLGNVVNGEYTGVIDKASNTGWQNLYISHDATIDPITDVGTFVSVFSQVYGGAAANAAADYATLLAKGNGSSDSANNGDGLGGGLRIEHDADLSSALGLAAFNGTRAQVEIYGKEVATVAQGVNVATAFPIHQDAMIFDNSGSAVDATTPEAGKIGKSGDTVLGDVAKLKLRYYLESTAPNGGIIQWDYVTKYSYTA